MAEKEEEEKKKKNVRSAHQLAHQPGWLPLRIWQLC